MRLQLYMLSVERVTGLTRCRPELESRPRSFVLDESGAASVEQILPEWRSPDMVNFSPSTRSLEGGASPSGGHPGQWSVAARRDAAGPA